MSVSLTELEKAYPIKKRMRFHTVVTIIIVGILVVVYPFLLDFISVSLSEPSYGHGESTLSYTNAHINAAAASAVMICATIVLGIIYLDRMKNRFRTDPHLPAIEPIFLAWQFGTFMLFLGIIFTGPGWARVIGIIGVGAFCFRAIYLVLKPGIKRG
jgi:hypothetical protein